MKMLCIMHKSAIGKYCALVGWFGRTLLEGVVGLLVVYFEENRGTSEKVGERV